MPPDHQRHSFRHPQGPHTGSSPTEGPPRRAFVPGPPTDPSFDAIVISFRCVSSGSHMFVFSSHTRPAHRETSTAALTTPALDRRSLRWFGISACTATPEDLPPSLAQHGSCRRSSTSSSLPFRTHVGAHNSVVGADQGFRAPSWDQESVHDATHEDSASARIATGQRPRPSFRAPTGSTLPVSASHDSSLTGTSLLQPHAGLWEPYDGRLSRTVLREREGEVPSRHSPGDCVSCSLSVGRTQRCAGLGIEKVRHVEVEPDADCGTLVWRVGGIDGRDE